MTLIRSRLAVLVGVLLVIRVRHAISGRPREDEQDSDEFDSHRKRMRPELALGDWHKEGFAFADGRGADFEALRVDKVENSLEMTRLHVANVTAAEFRRDYEPLHNPLVIEGIPETEGWEAAEWTISVLAQKYPSLVVRVGRDSEGSIELTMEEFERYARTNIDDNPLYVFDSHVYEDEVGKGKEAMAEYRVPSLFEEDLFQLLAGDEDYPDYRWLLVGPKRSGSMVHNDPLATSAWNALLSGRKLWFLAPPHLETAVIATWGEDAIKWFLDEVPKLKARYGDEIMLYVQHPGETLFVPVFWMHAVLNLDDSTAVTQNFAGTHNFPEVWEYTKLDLPGFAERWAKQLALHRQDLALVSATIDAEARGGRLSR